MDWKAKKDNLIQRADGENEIIKAISSIPVKGRGSIMSFSSPQAKEKVTDATNRV